MRWCTAVPPTAIRSAHGRSRVPSAVSPWATHALKAKILFNLGRSGLSHVTLQILPFRLTRDGVDGQAVKNPKFVHPNNLSPRQQVTPHWFFSAVLLDAFAGRCLHILNSKIPFYLQPSNNFRRCSCRQKSGENDGWFARCAGRVAHGWTGGGRPRAEARMSGGGILPNGLFFGGGILGAGGTYCRGRTFDSRRPSAQC